jgi:MerR family transcriptional regulator, thiopeptide resistance regulator
MVVEGSPVYQPHEFAELAGVTVRALHYYDRLGLLKPRRTNSDYRLYRAEDLECLEQIVALKFVGFPLKQIKFLLDRDKSGLLEALRMQRRVLEKKRRLLDSAISAIQNAEQSLQPGERADSALLKKIIEVLEMQNDSDWMMKYYSDEAKVKVEDRKQLWSPKLQARVEKEWSDLFRDVEAAVGEDPACETAQALVERWMELVGGFTGGDAQITEGVKALYNDRPNWPDGFQHRKWFRSVIPRCGISFTEQKQSKIDERPEAADPAAPAGQRTRFDPAHRVKSRGFIDDVLEPRESRPK